MKENKIKDEYKTCGQTIIHLGYGKSASTTLQDCIFPNLDIYFYGKGNCERDDGFRWMHKEAQSLTSKLINHETFSKFEDSEIKKLNDSIAKAQSLGKNFLFSNEQFSESVSPMFQARLFKEIFPNPKFFIVIRNQLDFLRSLYTFRGHCLEFAPKPYSGKYVSFNNFIDYAISNYEDIGGHKARDWHGDSVRIADYWNYVQCYISVFGRENVEICLFEDFVNNKSYFYKRMAVFFNISDISPDLEKSCRKNTSPSAAYIKMKRFRHYFFSYVKEFDKLKGFSFLRKKLIDYYSKKPNHKLEYTPEQIKRLERIFSVGNKNISESFDLDLKLYKYPLD